MSDAPLTFTDALIMAAILGSAFLALLRGIVHETLSLSAWLFSAVMAYALYQLTGPLLGSSVGGNWLLHAVYAGLLFLGLVVVFTVANRRLLVRIKKDNVATWDQVGGFVFGLARGLLVIGVLYHAHLLLAGPKATPPWLREARLFPMIKATSNVLKVALPGTITNEQGARSGAAARVRPAPKPGTGPDADKDQETGYSEDDRTAIDKLLRNRLDPG